MVRRIPLLALALLWCVWLANAQTGTDSVPGVRAVRIDQAPEFDGLVDEALWGAIEPTNSPAEGS